MLIQKTFHIRQGLEVTKARLHNFRTYRRAVEIIDVSSLTSSQELRFAFVSGNGFHANVQLEWLESGCPNETLFRSTDGNLEVAGMVEFIPVRNDLTEVHLTIDYAIKSPMHSVLDAVTGSLDRFVNRQLRHLQSSLAGTEPSSECFSTRSGYQHSPLAA